MRPDSVFVDAIRAERDALNSRFAARRLAGGPLDGEALLAHLRITVERIVRAMHAVFPERIRAAMVPLFDASLDLLDASLLGPQAKFPCVDRVWREVLPVAAPLLAREPLRVAGCLSNAAAFLAAQRGTRPEAWIARMTAVAPHCQSVPQLLDCGRIAAWQAGAAQFRAAALRIASAFPPPLAARALGRPSDTPEDRLHAAIERLQQNPWLTIEAALDQRFSTTPRSVGVAGAFRGFGGEFVRPPTAILHGGRLFASDGQSAWQVLADAYGVWLHRIGHGLPGPSDGPARPDVAVEANGTVRWGQTAVRFPQLAAVTSFACDGSTLAVTTPTSHHVYLFGLTDDAA